MLLYALIRAALLGLLLSRFASAQTSGIPAPSVPGVDPNAPSIVGQPGGATVVAADHTSTVCPTSAQVSALNQIENFVVLKFGAAGFNYLMGTYPGAANILTLMAGSNGQQYPVQKDQSGNAYPVLPSDPSDGFNQNLPNAPVELTTSGLSVGGVPVTTSSVLGNPSHSFWQQQLKLNGGQCDSFVAFGDTHGALAMGYFDLRNFSSTGMWAAANNYGLFDRYFSSTFGDSTIAHFYAVGSRAVPFDASLPGQCPTNVVQQYNTSAFMQTQLQNGFYYPIDTSQQPPLTRDCYFIGELNAASLCTGSGLYMPQIPSSPQTPTHFGDVCEAHNLTWAYYSEAFNAYEFSNCKYNGSRQFNVHEEPFAHFGAFDTTSSYNGSYWQLHQKDTNQFWDALNGVNGQQLEQVSWWNVAQVGPHIARSPGPPYVTHASPTKDASTVAVLCCACADARLWAVERQHRVGQRVPGLMDGQHDRQQQVAAGQGAGGHHDGLSIRLVRLHPAYAGDRFGPGLRLPFVVMSPFHKGPAVNHDPYEPLRLMRTAAASHMSLTSIHELLSVRYEMYSIFKSSTNPRHRTHAVHSPPLLTPFRLSCADSDLTALRHLGPGADQPVGSVALHGCQRPHRVIPRRERDVRERGTCQRSEQHSGGVLGGGGCTPAQLSTALVIMVRREAPDDVVVLVVLRACTGS